MMTNAIDDILEEPEYETALESISRYERLLEAFDDPDEAAAYQIGRAGPDALETISTLAQSLDFPLPEDILAFYQEYGGVQLGGDGWHKVRLYGAAEMHAGVLQESAQKYPLRYGLIDFIHYVWGGRPEFEDALRAEQIAQLNHDYLVIGLTAIDDNAHRYLYVDRSGNCGAVIYDQDCFDELHDDVLIPMLDCSPAEYDFDSMFSAEVQRVMEALAKEHC